MTSTNAFGFLLFGESTVEECDYGLVNYFAQSNDNTVYKNCKKRRYAPNAPLWAIESFKELKDLNYVGAWMERKCNYNALF